MLLSDKKVRQVTIEEKNDLLNKYFAKKERLAKAFIGKRKARRKYALAKRAKKEKLEYMRLCAEYDEENMHIAIHDHAKALEVYNREEKKYLNSCDRCDVFLCELRDLREDIKKANMVLGLL